MTVIVQVPPAARFAAQPVALNGACVANDNDPAGKATLRLLFRVSDAVRLNPWTVAAIVIAPVDSVNGNTLVPVNVTVCGLVMALCHTRMAAFSAVVGAAVGVKATVAVHDPLAGSVVGQPVSL